MGAGGAIPQVGTGAAEAEAAFDNFWSGKGHGRDAERFGDEAGDFVAGEANGGRAAFAVGLGRGHRSWSVTMLWGGSLTVRAERAWVKPS